MFFCYICQIFDTLFVYYKISNRNIKRVITVNTVNNKGEKNVFSFIKNFFKPHDKNEKVVLGILIFDVYPAAEMIRNGFVNTLSMQENGQKYDFITFNALGSYDKIESLVESIIEHKISLVLTIGSECTVVARDIFKKRNITIPIVFVDVKDPIRLDIIKSYASPERKVTGVVSFGYDYRERLVHLFKMQPTLSKLLVIHGVDHRNILHTHDDVVTINEVCSHYKVKPTIVAMKHKADIRQLYEVISDDDLPDMIFTLRDEIVMAGMKEIVAVAQRARIPIFSSDLASLGSGAMFACGSDDYRIGRESGQPVITMLAPQHKPEHVPLSLFKDPYVLKGHKATMDFYSIRLNSDSHAWICQHGGLE
jgi:putative ABC transport system substrate-binding protein